MNDKAFDDLIRATREHGSRKRRQFWVGEVLPRIITMWAIVMLIVFASLFGILVVGVLL